MLAHRVEKWRRSALWWRVWKVCCRCWLNDFLHSFLCFKCFCFFGRPQEIVTSATFCRWGAVCTTFVSIRTCSRHHPFQCFWNAIGSWIRVTICSILTKSNSNILCILPWQSLCIMLPYICNWYIMHSPLKCGAEPTGLGTGGTPASHTLLRLYASAILCES